MAASTPPGIRRNPSTHPPAPLPAVYFLLIALPPGFGQLIPALQGKRVDILVTDGNLISSRKPDDIPAFNKALIAALSGDQR